MSELGLREKACMSYWFQKVVDAGALVPRTELMTTDVELWRMLDDGKVPGVHAFGDQLVQAMRNVGGPPCFLRTGHGSDKHGWMRTCFVGSHTAAATDLSEHERWRNVLLSHVCELVDWSYCVDFMGLPTKVWAVRELLPLRAKFTAYRGMPVAREYRLFIANNAICCMHPYWPKEAVKDGEPADPEWSVKYDKLFAMDADVVQALATAGASTVRAFADDGAWSLDLAQHDDGRWFVIDMAPAELSFHWEGCSNEKRWGR